MDVLVWCFALSNLNLAVQVDNLFHWISEKEADHRWIILDTQVKGNQSLKLLIVFQVEINSLVGRPIKQWEHHTLPNKRNTFHPAITLPMHKVSGQLITFCLAKELLIPFVFVRDVVPGYSDMGVAIYLVPELTNKSWHTLEWGKWTQYLPVPLCSTDNKFREDFVWWLFVQDNKVKFKTLQMTHLLCVVGEVEFWFATRDMPNFNRQDVSPVCSVWLLVNTLKRDRACA